MKSEHLVKEANDTRVKKQNSDRVEFGLVDPKVRLRREAVVRNEQNLIVGTPPGYRESCLAIAPEIFGTPKPFTGNDRSVEPSRGADSIAKKLNVNAKSPSVFQILQLDEVMSIRFFSKLAIGMGHLKMGEVFSSSPQAALLRSNMNIGWAREMTIPGAAFWPKTAKVSTILDIISDHNVHTIALVDGTPPVLIVSLFGKYGALIPLGEIQATGDIASSAQGTVWQIDFSSTRLIEQSFGDFVKRKSEHLFALDEP